MHLWDLHVWEPGVWTVKFSSLIVWNDFLYAYIHFFYEQNVQIM